MKQDIEELYNERFYIGSKIKTKLVHNLKEVDYTIISIDEQENKMVLEDSVGYKQTMNNGFINNYEVKITS